MSEEKLYCWACYANYAELIEARPHRNCPDPDLESLGGKTVYTHYCPKCRMDRSDGSHKEGSKGTVRTEKWLRENCTPNTDWTQWVD